MRTLRTPSASLLPMLLALASLLTVATAQELQFPDFAKPARQWSGSDTAIEDSRYLVVSDQATWDKLWLAHAPKATAPKVDFGTAMVLAVFQPKWAKGGFAIAGIHPGTLSSDMSSCNVALVAKPMQSNRFLMVQVDRSRREFRFLALAETKGRQVARVESYHGKQPAASLITAADELLRQHATAKPARKKILIARLAAFGEPIRPYLNQIKQQARGARFWSARDALIQMLADEAQAKNKPISFSEVALAKAIAAVAHRTEMKGDPHYMRQDCRRVDGIWYVALQGTFRIFSDSKTASQPGVWAQVALRATDGKVLQCTVQREKSP